MDRKKLAKFFPIFMAIFIIPLSIRLIPVKIPKSVYFNWNMHDTDYDIFSYFRVILLCINTLIIFVIMFFNFDREKMENLKKVKYLIYPFFAMVIISLVSCFLGDLSLSFMGAPQRYEGLLTYISYFAIFLYTLTYDFNETTKKVIFYTVCVFTTICFVVGLSQFLGKNLLTTEFVKKLYISSDILKNSKLVDSDMGFRNMYIFTSHYNYASMLCSILSSYFITYFMTEDELKIKITAFVMAILSLFMLFGTNGRSGIVALFITILVMSLFFFKQFFHDKKSVIFIIVCIIALIALAVKLNMVSRFASMIKDGQKIETDIKKDINLKDIICSKDGYEINYKDTILKFDKNKSMFTDKDGKPLAFKMPVKGTIVFDDPKYKNFSLKAVSKKLPAMDKNHLMHEYHFDKNTFYIDINKDKTQLVNLFGTPIDPYNVKRIGFKGMEKMGSGRFYIISATLPLILKSPLLGYGADGFINNFNQDDIFTKLYIYKNAYELIDKPHNLFLLYSVDFGLVFTAIFIYMVILTLIKNSKNKVSDPFFISAVSAVIAYVSAGFFNDSTVSISPIFWVMFAISIISIIKDGKK